MLNRFKWDFQNVQKLLKYIILTLKTKLKLFSKLYFISKALHLITRTINNNNDNKNIALLSNLTDTSDVQTYATLLIWWGKKLIEKLNLKSTAKWCHNSVILATLEPKARGSQVQGTSALQNELKASLGNGTKPCPKYEVKRGLKP